MFQKKNNIICGIIAEYNPFHNGHKYHIEKSKEMTGADYTVVVMSGDFVQRGTPSVFDKYTRTKMALMSGADLVLELPCVYASSAANYFASGAVSLLNSLNCIDYISFGSESGSVDELNELSKTLLSENDDIHAAIINASKEGLTFPQAQNVAFDDPLLRESNNILAIEYLKALNQTNSSIKPITIKRCGNDYNDENLPNNNLFPSATSIRNAIFAGDQAYTDFIPSDIRSLYNSPFVSLNDFSDSLYYCLLKNLNNGYSEYLEINDDLSNRIRKYVHEYKDAESFAHLIKSKNYTLSRIRRALLHILLDIKDTDVHSPITYSRILGFKKDTRELLGILNENCSINIISKLADSDISPMLAKDIFASELYMHQIQSSYSEYSQPIIIL